MQKPKRKHRHEYKNKHKTEHEKETREKRRKEPAEQGYHRYDARNDPNAQMENGVKRMIRDLEELKSLHLRLSRMPTEELSWYSTKNIVADKDKTMTDIRDMFKIIPERYANGVQRQRREQPQPRQAQAAPRQNRCPSR